MYTFSYMYIGPFLYLPIHLHIFMYCELSSHERWGGVCGGGLTLVARHTRFTAPEMHKDNMW